MTRQLSSDDIEAIRAALLEFFDTAARPLPWRSTDDPYAIWVSEVMAQQTRVETAIPYYERWLGQFPDVATLADAPIDDVLKAWEGLGYYSRARNLHTAAQVVRERHQGAVPDSYDALRALPGVGEYTAGAIASIAFGARHAAVDGNVRRVLSRVLDEPAPSAALLRDVAGSIVPADRPGDFNQAVMELGATICSPKSPRCHICPIARHCRARAAGTQADRPAARKQKPVPVIDIATAVIHDGDGRLLVARRPATGLLAGLWSFPGVDAMSIDDAGDQVREIALRFASSSGIPRPIGIVEHTFSHRRERYHCFMIDAVPLESADDDVAWIDGRDSQRALPRAQQRILAMALGVIEERQMH
jgi:A/G-specific adenine glycosylase